MVHLESCRRTSKQYSKQLAHTIVYKESHLTLCSQAKALSLIPAESLTWFATVRKLLNKNP